METIQIGLNKTLLDAASAYARERGLSLSEMIEDYLIRIVKMNKTMDESKNEVPDIVQSLLGAGESVPDEDLNGRKSYYSYLEKKQE